MSESMEVDPAPPTVVEGTLDPTPVAVTAPSLKDNLDLPSELVYCLIAAWKGTKYPLTVVESDTVGDLKSQLWSLTNVPPERQKIIGLVKGKLPGDEAEVVSLGLIGAGGKPKEFMMIGTPEGEEHKEVGPTTEREKEIDLSPEQLAQHQAAQGVRNRRKLKEAIDSTKLDIMNAPRSGKRLLVIDLDYCIIETSLWKEPNFIAEHFARPYLHEMMEAVSPHYDIIFWSQTSWRWLEQKLVELDIIGSMVRSYPIVTTVDRSPMFSVYSTRDNKPYKHEVKALALLWAKFPEFYSKANTLHIDDLGRNFAMNPENGIRVRAYKDAMNNRDTDQELIYVARYLLQTLSIPDVSTLDHSKFRKCTLPLPAGTNDPATWIKTTKPADTVPGASTSNTNDEGGGNGAGPSAGGEGGAPPATE